MPAYTDPVRAAEILADYDLTIAAWDAQMDPLRTAKWRIYDTGFGLMVFAGLFTLAALRFRLWEPSSLHRASSPSSKSTYLLLTVAVWLSFATALAQDFANDHHRELVHLLDDGAERGLAVFLHFLLIFCGLSVLFKLLVLKKVNLPVILAQWDELHPEASWLFTGIYGIWAALLLLAAGLLAFTGKWAGLPLAFGAYLVLCQRAIRLSSNRSL